MSRFLRTRARRAATLVALLAALPALAGGGDRGGDVTVESIAPFDPIMRPDGRVILTPVVPADPAAPGHARSLALVARLNALRRWRDWTNGEREWAHQLLVRVEEAQRAVARHRFPDFVNFRNYLARSSTPERRARVRSELRRVARAELSGRRIPQELNDVERFDRAVLLQETRRLRRQLGLAASEATLDPRGLFRACPSVGRYHVDRNHPFYPALLALRRADAPDGGRSFRERERRAGREIETWLERYARGAVPADADPNRAIAAILSRHGILSDLWREAVRSGLVDPELPAARRIARSILEPPADLRDHVPRTFSGPLP